MSRSWDEAEDEAAALWVSRHLGGMIDATEFNAWLAGAPRRRQRFDALWASCMDPTVNDALQAIDGHEAPPAPAARQRTAMRMGVGMAAAAAACLLAAILLWPTLRFAIAPTEHFATRAGEMRTIALADGSQVTLAGGSRLAVTLVPDRRHVVLETGEAFFAVAHDAERPFAVHAADGRATVLGTRFDVALAGDGVELTVEQGLVRFEPEDERTDAVLVGAGYRSVLQGGRAEQPSAIPGQPVAAWRDGWIDIDDMTLARLAIELQRWTARRIVIRDTALGEKRVAGRFRLTAPQRLLETLGAMYQFKVEASDDAYVLSRQPGEPF